MNFSCRAVKCCVSRENFFTFTLAENLMFMGDKFESLFNWELATFRRSSQFDLLLKSHSSLPEHDLKFIKQTFKIRKINQFSSLPSASQQVSKEELAKIVQGFDKTELLTSGGVTLAGQRYIYLSGTDRVIRAKLGKMGVHCMKTQQGKFYGPFIPLPPPGYYALSVEPNRVGRAGGLRSPGGVCSRIDPLGRCVQQTE